MSSNRRRSGLVVKKRNSLNRSKLGARSAANRSNTALQGKSSCIQVIVRVRPLSEKESGKGREVVSAVDEQLLIFDPPEEDEGFFFQGQKQLHRDLNKRANKNVRFLFDRVFDCSSTNEYVFKESVTPVIENLFAGYNCSVFAYGATGAGKTFTMLGSPTEPGIIYLIVQDIFKRMQEIANKTCDLNISYLEVYNETVKDLLSAVSPPLILRDDSKNVTVAGLTFQKPTCAEQLLELLRHGNKNRTQHPTDANAESSRSHAVFQIYLKIKDKVSGLAEHVQLSKMSLIDLAGSERACVVSNHGRARQREGANINQSLLALGTCINALATKNGRSQHIPYRNSKLTRILKDSLGGNCKTVMIAALSPSSVSYEDTYNTLRYAERAKRITITLRRNTTQVDAHLTGYREKVSNLQLEVDSLKQANESLKRKLADLTEETAKRQKVTESNDHEADIATKVAVTNEVSPQEEIYEMDPEWKEKIDSLCCQILKLKKNILDSESQLQSVRARQFWRQFSHNRVTALTADHNKITRSHNKLDTFKKSMQVRTERHTSEKLKNLELYEQKMKILIKLRETEEFELKRTYIEVQLCKMDTSALHSHLSHTIELSTSNFKQTCEAWKVCEESLLHVRRLQSTLKGHGFLTSDLVSKYDDLLKQAECGREVAWADEPPLPNGLHQEFLQHLLLPSSGFLLPTTFPAAEVDAVPLTTNCLENEDPKQEAFAVPLTPCKGSRNTVFASPSILSQVSPVYSKVPMKTRKGSPHPLSQLNNEQLLALIGNEVPTVRKSLEETFISSSQGPRESPCSSEWPMQAEGRGLHNLTFSPVGISNVLSNRPATSTPSYDRLKHLRGNSFIVEEEPHSTVNSTSYNSELLSEPNYHLHLEAAGCSNACPQMHHQQLQDYCVHEVVTRCHPTSGVLGARQRPSCSFPRNSVAPATVVRSGRQPTPRRHLQPVHSVLPNVRGHPAFPKDVKPMQEQYDMQGTSDRALVSSTSGSFKVPAARKLVTTKENLDPRRISEQRIVKRVPSGVQRNSVTPHKHNTRKYPAIKTMK